MQPSSRPSRSSSSRRSANLPEAPQYESRRKSGCGSNALGILIFALVFGSQFITPLVRNLSGVFGQNTAQQFATSIAGLLPYIIFGLVALSVLAPILVGIQRQMNEVTESKSTKVRDDIDSPLPPSMASLPRSEMLSSWMDSSHTVLPGTMSRSTLPRAPQPSGINLDRIHTQQIPQDHARTRTYTTPSFEPLINGTILVYGITVMLVAAGLLAVLDWLARGMP